MSVSPDVIIVGAGAAGIGAARQLAGAGISYLVVEARGRVGGRAWTVQDLAAPIDLGCSWLWNPSHNPLVPLASQFGFALIPDNKGAALFDSGHPAGPSVLAAYEAEKARVNKAISEAARQGFDRPVADVVAPDGAFATLVGHQLGPWMMGADSAQVSLTEWYDGVARETDLLVPAGLGTVVTRAADGLNISLNAAVMAIDWSGAGVRVETAKGELRAKAAIVTLPFGVLAAGGVRFTPELPAAPREVIDGLPMGLLNKVFLEFAEPCIDLPAHTAVYPTSGASTVMWQANLGGAPLLMGLLGGSVARELEAQGEEAILAHGREEAKQTFGADIDRHYSRGRASLWGADPWARGSYTVAPPGQGHLRGAFLDGIDERLWFAGEGWCPHGDAALVGGAFADGMRKAASVATALKR